MMDVSGISKSNFHFFGNMDSFVKQKNSCSKINTSSL